MHFSLILHNQSHVACEQVQQVKAGVHHVDIRADKKY